MDIVTVIIMAVISIVGVIFVARKLMRLNMALRTLEQKKPLHELELSVEDLLISRVDAENMSIEKAKELAQVNRVGLIFLLLLCIGLTVWTAALAVDIVPQSRGELPSLENIQP